MLRTSKKHWLIIEQPMKNDIDLSLQKINTNVTIQLPISKSECNRALILSFLSQGQISIEQISDSEDTQTLSQLLSQIEKRESSILDCGPAGTTFRFLTTLLSITEGEFTLTGSSRMKERPIGELVEVLKKIGAEIYYLEKEGFPPLKIKGKKLLGGSIEMNPGTSSQFVSALMLISSQLEKGIEINFSNEPVSFPYIEMTASLLKEAGIKVDYSKKKIVITHQKFQKTNLVLERDWSAASYFYSMVALQKDLKITLPGLKQNSLQGDSVVQHIYEQFGVVSTFNEKGLTIFNNQTVYTDYFEYDFSDCPDLAQTLAFTCGALQIPAHLTGLSTLRKKETDRIQALENELKKIGVNCSSTIESLRIASFDAPMNKLFFETYDDHRMAMAAAPLILKYPSMTIEDKLVVGKSFPMFWEEINKIINSNVIS